MEYVITDPEVSPLFWSPNIVVTTLVGKVGRRSLCTCTRETTVNGVVNFGCKHNAHQHCGRDQ